MSSDAKPIGPPFFRAVWGNWSASRNKKWLLGSGGFCFILASGHCTRLCGERRDAASSAREFLFKLVCYLAKTVDLPEVLIEQTTHQAISALGLPCLDVLQTDDIDWAVRFINRKNNYLVVDISEVPPTELLTRVQIKLNEEALSFDFAEREAIIPKAIRKRRKIILQGKFSPELADELLAYCLESSLP